MDPRIVQYYKLCTITAGGQKHPVSDIRDEITVVYTKREREEYFEERGDILAPREFVIGGAIDDHPRVLVV